MSAPKYFEEINPGDVFKTFGRTITEADIVLHAGQSGDFYPHHLNAEFAKTTPFRQRIAHGTLTFTVVIGLKACRFNPVAFTYGFDRIRFPKPVYIGDTISVLATIVTKQEDPKRPRFGRYIERVEATNQRGEVVLVCDHIALVERAAPLSQPN